MIVLTSLLGLCITTKRNIISDTIPGICLMVRSGIIKPWNATTKVIEHQFGNLCQDTSKFYVHKLAQLCEKNARHMDLMFSNDFVPNRDPRKGYRGTILQWYKSNRYQDQESGRLLVVSGYVVPVIGKVWSVVRGLIPSALRSDKLLLTALGVKASDISLFCRDFQISMELRDVFIKELPCNFRHSNINGAGDNRIVSW